uniref:Uncharacterized protein n=1 Tax=Craspedostauros australis TaxID=1486917 RepID=A0A7R9WLJ4_9STRA|mmetsp:Transcript_1084/g.3164  ORF Transcript_1084/g.3164 Transcript_1084/m.3164 type:complete len:129 (+) Transcript_1084:189-575(+)
MKHLGNAIEPTRPHSSQSLPFRPVCRLGQVCRVASIFRRCVHVFVQHAMAEPYAHMIDDRRERERERENFWIQTVGSRHVPSTSTNTATNTMPCCTPRKMRSFTVRARNGSMAEQGEVSTPQRNATHS